MPICKKCNDYFPNRMEIDGKKRCLHKRKYCISCSPYGQHNTRKLNNKMRKDQKPHNCSSCGETDPNKFYGHKRTICGACHNKYTLQKGLEKRQKAIDYLGGKCQICDYNKHYGALEFHHLDPSIKDPKYGNLRSWSWDRIVREIQKCVLLCANCHREVHAEVTSINKEYNKD